MTNVLEFKKSETPISVITCYDFWSAKIISQTDIDAVLVGDSVSMVMHGFESTVSATLDMMCMHVAAVKKGLEDKFIIADLPFLMHRKGNSALMNSVDQLIKCGANAVKIEGGVESLDAIKYVVDSGVPVMGHLGLTPQSINKLGGYKVQGREESTASTVINDALELQNSGVFAIVLELIPANLAKRITEKLTIPTIGIGAGKYTDGQVLVLHDMLGFNNEFKPKFLRKYADGFTVMNNALNRFNNDVKSRNFPNDNESFE